MFALKNGCVESQICTSATWCVRWYSVELCDFWLGETQPRNHKIGTMPWLSSQFGHQNTSHSWLQQLFPQCIIFWIHKLNNFKMRIGSDGVIGTSIIIGHNSTHLQSSTVSSENPTTSDKLRPSRRWTSSAGYLIVLTRGQPFNQPIALTRVLVLL